VPVPRLLVVGELNADIVVQLDEAPRFDDFEHVVPRTDIVLGSSSAIMACGAARMSVPTSLVSVVGGDLLGRFVVDELRSRDVDTSAVKVDGNVPTGSSTILTLPGGDRSILTALGTIGRVRVADIPTALLARSAHVHVGSFFLQDALRGELPALYRECRARGVSTSVDPNLDPAGEWGAGLVDVLPEVDVFFCNEREAAAISGSSDVEAACAWFAERLPASAQVVVKRGSRGAVVAVCGDGRVTAMYAASPPAAVAGMVGPGPGAGSGAVETVDETASGSGSGIVGLEDEAGSRSGVVGLEDDAGSRSGIVDTVGAGDSLAAGYLAARLRGLPVEQQLQVGVRNGTASTRAAGGTAGQLTWEQATHT
jgi:sugar/nucleoside kinase (ribokinase family)